MIDYTVERQIKAIYDRNNEVEANNRLMTSLKSLKKPVSKFKYLVYGTIALSSIITPILCLMCEGGI